MPTSTQKPHSRLGPGFPGFIRMRSHGTTWQKRPVLLKKITLEDGRQLPGMVLGLLPAVPVCFGVCSFERIVAASILPPAPGCREAL